MQLIEQVGSQDYFRNMHVPHSKRLSTSCPNFR